MTKPDKPQLRAVDGCQVVVGEDGGVYIPVADGKKSWLERVDFEAQAKLKTIEAIMALEHNSESAPVVGERSKLYNIAWCQGVGVSKWTSDYEIRCLLITEALAGRFKL